jgi:hypothetical protein
VFHTGGDLQTNVSFDVRLLSPSPASKGIAEISGHLVCRIANDLRVVELISGSSWIGSKGTPFETSVDEVMRVGNDKDRLVIRTRLAPEQLMSLTAVDGKGVTTRLERQGMMNVGGVYTYTFLSQRTVPRSGKLMARVISGTNTVRVPFTVTNLTLSGHALARR